MTKPAKHVAPNGRGGWVVLTSGARRANRNFERRDEAVRYATAAAQKARTVLYLHRLDGTIENRLDYGAAATVPGVTATEVVSARTRQQGRAPSGN